MELITTNGKTVLIDKDDLELISKYTWTAANDGYAKKYLENKIDGQRVRSVVSMHRMIMAARPGQIVDHINRNKLDNRKENLRFASKSLNAFNSDKIRSRCCVRNVTWSRQRGKWHAIIQFNKKRYHIGFFQDLEEAAKQVSIRRKQVLDEYSQKSNSK